MAKTSDDIPAKRLERMEKKKRKLKAFLDLINDDLKQDSEESKTSRNELTAAGGDHHDTLSMKDVVKKRIKSKPPKIVLCQEALEPSNPDESTQSIEFSEMQQMIVSCFIPSHLSSFKPSFCDIQNIDSESKIKVFLVEDPSLFILEEHEKRLFPDVIKFAVCDNWMDRMMMVPLSKTFAARIQKEGVTTQKVETTQVEPSTPATKTQLLLSLSQMAAEGYPIPGPDQLYQPSLSSYERVTDESPLFSLDCEMCMTTAQKLEVTKIVIINEKEEVVLDSYVKPDNRITDYMTHFSGVTKEILEPIETRIEEIRQKICQLLPPDAILVGQSLENDLKCLGIFHPYIIDTSIIFNLSGCRSIKASLKNLAFRFLNERIQSSEDGSGHCPFEDARSSLRLVKLKLSKGLKFGDNVISDKRFGWSRGTRVDFLPLAQFMDQRGIAIHIFYDYVDFDCFKSLTVFSSKCLKTKEFIMRCVSKVSRDTGIHIILTSDGLCYINCCR